jgi:hypothetical protein
VGDSTQVAEADSPPLLNTARLELGLYVEPGLRDLADGLKPDLAEELGDRYPEVHWEVSLAEGEHTSSQGSELIGAARRYMLGQSWDLVICLTKLPLRSRHRPVIAQASATDGVGLISVPALGPVGVGRRARDAVLNLVEGLVGETRRAGDGDDKGTRLRVAARLRELASPLGKEQVRGDATIRFSAAVVRGNLRLLLGMVRANDPARVVMRLSRALVAALGTAAYVTASFSFWQLSVNVPVPRLLALTLITLAVTSVTMIAAHDLWERSEDPDDRERVVLFNAATTLTITLGVLTLYAALFALVAVSSLGFIPADFFSEQTGEPADLAHILQLAWFATSVATLAGALGSLTESDLSVREAAYGYHPDSRIEDAVDADEGDQPDR